MRGIVEKIRTKLDERPFRPFTIFTSDGKVATVKNPMFAWIHPAGRTMYVCEDPASDADEIIHLVHVTKLASGSVRHGNNRRKR
jgi:hypothetical protein